MAQIESYQRNDRRQEKLAAEWINTATHLLVDPEAELDSLAISDMLARHFADLAYDVISCGKQSQDTDAGLTGSMLAERLQLPYATNAVGLDAEGRTLTVT